MAAASMLRTRFLPGTVRLPDPSKLGVLRWRLSLYSDRGGKKQRRAEKVLKIQ